MCPWPRLYCGRAFGYFHTADVDRRSGDSKNLRIFFLHDRRDFFFRLVNDVRIGGAADEARDRDAAFARAAREERRIPHGPQRAKFFAARDQQAEAIERVADLLA